MDNDRYAPPTARVADTPPRDPASRPRQVTLAVRLLWASLLLALPSFYIAMDHAPEDASNGVIIVVQIILMALAGYLNLCIGQGRNWARIVALILTVLSLLMVFFLPTPPDETVIEQLINGVSSVLDVVAMVLIFTQPGASWFNGAARGR